MEYTLLVFEQQKEEIKIFNKATMEVLSIANIKATVFNQSVELHMLAKTKTEDIMNACQRSFYSPFEVEKPLRFTECLTLLN